jgi:protocatechuate 3,4-dioxygenase beta subunit
MGSKGSRSLVASWLLATAASAACSAASQPSGSAVSEPVAGQDLEYNRAVHAAQLARPVRLTASERIAPEDEPGTALAVHGRVLAADGRTPLAGAVVFAYHTDRTGIYRAPGEPAHTWRLKGWAMTDPDGRFEFRTIRPGPYPGGTDAAHIHLTLFTEDGTGYHAGGLLFDDDPLVSAAEREASRRAGKFGTVCAVRREGAAERVDISIRLDLRQRF